MIIRGEKLMGGKFSLKKFSNININDSFFDSLKKDYPGTENSTAFVEWFKKKSNAGAEALVFEDKFGIGAFIAFKTEEEQLFLKDKVLPSKSRVKISTFCISERYRRQRIGEGAIGLLLWQWRRSNTEEIYVTVFEKHGTLISQFEKFGFVDCGFNLNDEKVLIKSCKQIDFSNPYKSYPFIKSDFDYAGYIIIDDKYHDTMFAYSELANVKSMNSNVSNSVINGLSKIYVGKSPFINHKIGEPVLVYRRYTGGSGARYKSCITSYCIITDIIQAKTNNKYLISFEELKSKIKNKSVFDERELSEKYHNYKNVLVIELLYYGYFGAGNNVNMDWLDNHGCWTKNGEYPTEIHLSKEQFKNILSEGNLDVSTIIID